MTYKELEEEIRVQIGKFFADFDPDAEIEPFDEEIEEVDFYVRISTEG